MLSNPDIIAKIKNGAVGIIPTDTVYGIVCSALDTEAVARLYTLKHRHQKPGTLVAASVDQFVDLGIPRRYLKPVEEFWPNPLSIVVPIGPSHQELHMGKMSLALRIPKHPELQQLLQQTGPLLTSSANLPTKPIALTVDQAKAYFGDQVDFYVDGGDLTDHKPSTIIRVVDDAIEVLREGAVVIDAAGVIQEA